MDEYISREAMLKNLTSDLEHHSDEGDPRTGLVMRRFIKYVEDFPAADVQPIRRGRWLPSDSYITAAYGTIHCQICSECGADLMEDSDYDYDFCPVCGARMDLGDEKT